MSISNSREMPINQDMSTDHGTSRERQPLLAPDGRITQAPVNRQNPTAVSYCLLIMVLISAFYAFTEAPSIRLYESVLCREYYKEQDPFLIGYGGEIPEEKCKNGFIQQNLSMVTSKQVRFNAVACKYI
jgi:hypothetical protein